jgi:hypothetical protein
MRFVLHFVLLNSEDFFPHAFWGMAIKAWSYWSSNCKVFWERKKTIPTVWNLRCNKSYLVCMSCGDCFYFNIYPSLVLSLLLICGRSMIWHFNNIWQKCWPRLFECTGCKNFTYHIPFVAKLHHNCSHRAIPWSDPCAGGRLPRMIFLLTLHFKESVIHENASSTRGIRQLENSSKTVGTVSECLNWQYRLVLNSVDEWCCNRVASRHETRKETKKCERGLSLRKPRLKSSSWSHMRSLSLTKSLKSLDWPHLRVYAAPMGNTRSCLIISQPFPIFFSSRVALSCIHLGNG